MLLGYCLHYRISDYACQIMIGLVSLFSSCINLNAIFLMSHKMFRYDIALFELQLQISVVNDRFTIKFLENLKVVFT